jgi:hypothetical protein
MLSWNELFYWLALMSLALAVAQLGIYNIAPTVYERILTQVYERIFRREPPTGQVHEMVRVLPNFLAVVSIIAIILAIFAAVEIVSGLAESLALLIAKHFGYSGDNMPLLLTAAGLFIAMAVIVFIGVRVIWKAAARLPSKSRDTQRDIGAINTEIKRHLKEIRGADTKKGA